MDPVFEEHGAVEQVQVHLGQGDHQVGPLLVQVQVRLIYQLVRRRRDHLLEVRELEKVLAFYHSVPREPRKVHVGSLSHHLASHFHRSRGGHLQFPGEIPSLCISCFYRVDCLHIAHTEDMH